MDVFCKLIVNDMIIKVITNIDALKTKTMFAHRNSRNNYVILVDEHKMHIPDEFFGTKKFQEKSIQCPK